jgi:uncharacterized membrane protein YgdD (TMEM256/DUF423 family)
MNDSVRRAKLFFTIGSISAGIGVALGAFGAHSLKSSVAQELLAIFETAVRYQMYHSLGLMATALAISLQNGNTTKGFEIAGWCFMGGIVLFSGSLYALALTGLRWFGAITPLGGVAFIAGWAMLAWSGWKNR